MNSVEQWSGSAQAVSVALLPHYSRMTRMCNEMACKHKTLVGKWVMPALGKITGELESG